MIFSFAEIFNYPGDLVESDLLQLIVLIYAVFKCQMQIVKMPAAKMLQVYKWHSLRIPLRC